MQLIHIYTNKIMVQKLCLILIVLISVCASCTPPEKLRREMVYFNKGLDTAKLNKYILVEPVIQKGDLLQITISSRSSSSNQLFSQNYSATPIVGTSGIANSVPGSTGYLVDIATGDIKLPLLGTIHADGMTKLQLETEIVKRAGEYLREDPIVNIRYMNFSVTFLGAVQAPGRKTFESERISFLQALGEVGGILPGGSLENIWLMREQNGKREWFLIDLTNGDFLNSANYYLKQNDVVYVSPTKRQLQATDQSFVRTAQIIGLGFNVLNLLVILITLFQ
jgi:polysaccharide biosynthesis/export protein